MPEEPMQTLSDTLGHLLQAPYVYMVAVSIGLLAALYLVYSYRRSNQGIVPFKSQGGNIEIAPHTLRGVMQNAANSVEGVEKAVCRHFIKGRKVGVRVAIHLRANHRLRDVENQIKRRIRATLMDQFGMENVEPIHIRVSRIVGDPMATITEEPEVYPSQEADEDDDSPGDDRPYADETRI